MNERRTTSVMRREGCLGGVCPAPSFPEKGRGHWEELISDLVGRLLTFWSQSLPQSN